MTSIDQLEKFHIDQRDGALFHIKKLSHYSILQRTEWYQDFSWAKLNYRRIFFQKSQLKRVTDNWGPPVYDVDPCGWNVGNKYLLGNWLNSRIYSNQTVIAAPQKKILSQSEGINAEAYVSPILSDAYVSPWV